MRHRIYQKSRNGDVGSIAGRFLATFQLFVYGVGTPMEVLMHELKLIWQDFNVVYNKPRAESYLMEKDEVRDDKTQALYYLIQGYTHHPSAEINGAARVLFQQFQRIGLGFIHGSYAEQTSNNESLIQIFDSTSMQEQMALLSGVVEAYNAFKTAHIEFEDVFVALKEDQGEGNELLTACELKYKMLEVLNKKVLPYVDAMMVVDHDNYATFANTLYEMVDENNEVVRRRIKKEEEEPEENPGERKGN